ncbi:MAG: 2-succinyl-5-enolpyruvyl-6-hydroxy-3-cyclohexene-1-carboxylic-acid synthase, partial [Flavobacteriaceae bacterium]|nr:2-succinyl-5-enolpyruvyl-6-hydroxy-3-cyclohexene-1-carboxylic-acid synthase [Flavobacteriaceae bacterium]
MKYAAIPLAQTIVHLCAAKGIDHIVISPGSRNAPLTIGFTNHPEITTFSIVDERCAAFFALGLAQQLRRPVAVVCTSGSALLNYYPAVAEAFYSDLPLVVISADRPDALQEIGDGQTIQQQNVYGNHILYSANAREGSAHQRYNETELNVALNTAIECRGPVHINLPFSEPLYDTVAKPSVQPQNVPAREPVPSLPDDFSFFQKTWRGSERILVLWGVDFPGSVAPQLLQKLADDERVLVLTETPSNVHHPAFVPAIDQLIAPLSEEALLQLKPDLLLTMGGMVVSKKVKAFLRNHRPAQHWHVDTKKAYNTYFSLTHAISSSPRHFLEALLKDTDAQRGTYQPKWLQVKEHRLQRHAAYVAEIPFSDFKVF